MYVVSVICPGEKKMDDYHKSFYSIVLLHQRSLEMLPSLYCRSGTFVLIIHCVVMAWRPESSTGFPLLKPVVRVLAHGVDRLCPCDSCQEQKGKIKMRNISDDIPRREKAARNTEFTFFFSTSFKIKFWIIGFTFFDWLISPTKGMETLLNDFVFATLLLLFFFP